MQSFPLAWGSRLYIVLEYIKISFTYNIAACNHLWIFMEIFAHCHSSKAKGLATILTAFYGRYKS